MSVASRIHSLKLNTTIDPQQVPDSPRVMAVWVRQWRAI